MSYFSLDVTQFERVADKAMEFSDGAVAESIINDYLGGEGGDIIKERIRGLLPVSGRHWKGKKAAAKSTNPFRKTPGNLSVKIHTKGAYHYLYFPDDGSSTEKHYGNQQFMFEGASKSSDEIAEEIINRLIQRLEES